MIPSDELARLLEHCALHDRQAFTRLYQLSSAQLFGLILRIVKSRDIAGEVLQEGYIKIWHRAGDFDARKAKAMTWMGAIMRNQAIDLLRRATHRPGADYPIDEMTWLTDENPGPMEQTSMDHRDRQLHECFDRLEGAQKKALELAYFNGLTHEEIAHQLGSPLGTVKSWIRRGLLRLKDCLDAS